MSREGRETKTSGGRKARQTRPTEADRFNVPAPSVTILVASKLRDILSRVMLLESASLLNDQQEGERVSTSALILRCPCEVTSMRVGRSLPIGVSEESAARSKENAFSSAGESKACFPLAGLSDVYFNLVGSEGREGRPFHTISHGMGACAAACVIAQVWRTLETKPIDPVVNNAIRCVLESSGVSVKFVEEVHHFENLGVAAFGTYRRRFRVGGADASLAPKLSSRLSMSF